MEIAREEGGALLEAVLMMGLFLLFIMLTNRVVADYYLLVERIEGEVREGLDRVNQVEREKVFEKWVLE